MHTGFHRHQGCQGTAERLTWTSSSVAEHPAHHYGREPGGRFAPTAVAAAPPDHSCCQSRRPKRASVRRLHQPHAEPFHPAPYPWRSPGPGKEAGLLQSGGRGTVHPPAAYRSRRPTPRRTAFQPTPPNLLPARALRAASQFHPWRVQSWRGCTAPGPTGGTPTDVRYTAATDTGMLCRARK